MTKKAVCVGINDYPYDGNDLNGCVNDAKAWAELLISSFDFSQADVKLLLDAEATKSNMLTHIKGLLAGARSDDVLVFTNSSHGSYIADTSGDEPLYDEVLCPYDIADNALVDDELRELFADLPNGVRLTVVSDSCFSGKHYPESHMREILLSGCTDKEYSYDALIGGVYHGAMTYFALQAIRAADCQITYAQLESRLNALLDQAGYPQHPQLEGKRQNKKRQVFT